MLYVGRQKVLELNGNGFSQTFIPLQALSVRVKLRVSTSKKRCILFITGKGLNPPQNLLGEKKLYYGKIRNEFLIWTNNKAISKKILSVEQAGTSYGGDGAFFVYLRKNVKSW